MKHKFLFLIVGLNFLVFEHSHAQHQEIGEKATMYKGKQVVQSDSSSLLHAFKAGTTHGHFRYFFMATNNQPGLTDFYANAAGGGLKYETGRYKGFQFTVSGFYIFNMGSTDLSKLDSVTGQGNRYEVGLFDIEQPNNTRDMDRLEELNIKYHLKNAHFTLGKQLINTPFINLQDGRMRPTGVEGVWIDWQATSSTRIEGGLIYGISPRGTVRWFGVGESIGVLPGGVNPDGSRSGYPGNVHSKHIYNIGIRSKLTSQADVELWNLYVTNVMHTSMLQATYRFKDSKWYASGQSIFQKTVGEGGNADPSKAYREKGATTFTFGGRLGYKTSELDLTLNFNRITANSRYLMPREWGRDPFFTFMPRERNEGHGDVTAYMVKADYKPNQTPWRFILSAGLFDMPDVLNTQLNKYGMPSYSQINFDVRYQFSGWWKGLDAQFLMVAKQNRGNTHNNKRFEFNRVNMQLFNLVFNYHF